MNRRKEKARPDVAASGQAAETGKRLTRHSLIYNNAIYAGGCQVNSGNVLYFGVVA